LLNPTSKNIITANNVVNKIKLHEKIWVPVIPIFLPNRPGIIELIKGKIINVR
jgi:hypothetical protein